MAAEKHKEVVRMKKEYLAIILAILLGAVGFLGTGHFYLGRIRRGLILLIGGWGLIGVGLLCLIIWSMSGMVIPPPGYPEIEPPAISLVFLLVSIVLFLGFGGLWVWQIFNARTACRDRNQQLT
jgi:hypothetical protein